MAPVVLICAAMLLLGARQEPLPEPVASSDQPRVTGIGGVFFKADKGKELLAWYAEHLGITKDANGYVSFRWRELHDPERVGHTAWGAFKRDTKYFDPSDKPFMFNYRVNDLDGLLANLKEDGVTIVGEIERYDYGDFGWIMDPEGTKIELWEPKGEVVFDADREPDEDTQARAAVLAALQNYYEQFSARDWEAFAACFHHGAILATRWVPPGAETLEVMMSSVPEFIAKAPEGPGSQPIFEERMTDAKIEVERDLASVWVNYAAKFGTEDNLMEWTGIDAITLLKHDGRWRIVSLAFASESPD